MKKIAALILLLFLLFPLAFAGSSTLASHSYYHRLLELQQRIREYQAKIGELQNQERSLKNQISYLDYQIALTIAEIEALETEITLLSGDIENLEKRLANLSEALEFQEEILGTRVRESYKTSEVTSLDIIFNVSSLEDLFKRIKYLQVLAEQDRNLFEQLKTVKSGFAEQKTILEDKKAEVEEKKRQVEEKKVSLEAQRKEREWLLAVTQNDEQKYQGLLAQAKSETESINRALRESGSPIGYKNAGDFIATQGDSGCATGPHLHFEYRIGRYNPVNPKPYLDSGVLKWPEINPRITQWYGDNPQIYKYYGYPQGHPGIDMQADPRYGAPIFAAKAGEATLHTDNVWCYHLGRQVTGWGIKIDHGDGTYTLYWHIQSR